MPELLKQLGPSSNHLIDTPPMLQCPTRVMGRIADRHPVVRRARRTGMRRCGNTVFFETGQDAGDNPND
jgi:hypothetical protein